MPKWLIWSLTGCLVLVLLVCGGSIFVFTKFFRSFQEAGAGQKAVVDYLVSKNYAAARAKMTDALKKEASEQILAKRMSVVLAETGKVNRIESEMDDVSSRNGDFSYVGVVRLKGEKGSVWLGLTSVRQEGEWLVDDIQWKDARPHQRRRRE